MSLDGAFLHLVKTELKAKNLIGARVDKIHQPSRDEIVLHLRAQGGTSRLLFSANPMSARVCLTESPAENPKTPPMFCMLLRKHLGGGRLEEIAQDGLERILSLDFLCMNEIGDMVTNRLVIEIMGRSSNIMLLTRSDAGWRVIDSIKRVTDEVSSVRRVLPNITYELPPRPERLLITSCGNDEVVAALAEHRHERLHKALLKIFEGISPIFARECAYYAARDVDIAAGDVLDKPSALDRLLFFITRAREALSGGTARPVLVSSPVEGRAGKPLDFCFVPVEQYGGEMLVTPYDSASALLDAFFSSRSAADRMKQRSGELLKRLVNTYERILRKTELQKQELQACREREQFRVRGDLINANIYRIEKGQKSVTVDNYFTGGQETIELDARLTPAQNAQKYFSEYKKRYTAEKMLTTLIAEAEKELIYVDSVFDAVSRASGDSELEEIRRELVETGYLRGRSSPKGKKGEKQPKSLPPLRFVSSSGIEILVGRNNRQNDTLTLKTARPDDIWLHTQNIAGSHVIVCHADPDDATLTEAAQLAAYCSKARDSSRVPVDCTAVRYVKKPHGAKPGMVIFTNNKTLFVTPDENLYKTLKKE